MKIISRFSEKNDCYQRNLTKADSRYTRFQERGPLGLMLHSVGTPQPDASVFAGRWNRAGTEVAVHAVLQADGTVYQCLPWNYRGWHAGGSANDTHVGVEMTEPACIRYTGGSTFTCSDLSSAQDFCRGTWAAAVELFAKLCRAYDLDPMTAIISHAEGAKQGIASNHGDPEHLWKGLGMDYTMDKFRRAVQAKLQLLYRVRKRWDDAGGQLGAYSTREAAVQACPPGYAVFDSEGNEVYRSPAQAPNREQVLAALGDRFIRSWAELPDWAKPEVRAILDLGLIDGGSDDPEAINMLLSDIRVAIVAYRAYRLMQK